MASMCTVLRRALLQSLHHHRVARCSSHTNSMLLSSYQQAQNPPIEASSLSTTRCYASAATENNNNRNNTSPYVSPFQEIFDTIHEGKTFLGTTEFEVPPTKFLKCGIPEHVLKFKTTAYGKLLEPPYVRPNEHRITLQVHSRHLQFLTEAERLVLREIFGHRWNEETGVLQLSSSQFGSRIENKRHVVSMLERAVESAKMLAVRVEEEVAQLEAREEKE